MDLLAANPAVTRKSAGTQVGRVAAIHNPAPQPRKSQPLMETGFDQEQYIAETEDMRLKHLEEQAMYALKISCENFENTVFPNALIAGDVVITHLLHRLGTSRTARARSWSWTPSTS